MKKKLVSIVLAAAMVLSLAACGNESNETSKESTPKSEVKESESSTPANDPVEDDAVTYPLDTDEKLTIAMMYYDFKTTPNSADITQTPYFEEYQKRTGVKLEVITYETQDAYNLTLAGDEMPDIIMWAPVLTSSDQQMIDDGMVSPLTMDEINAWAPNYAAVLEQYPNARKELTMADGSILGFAMITGSEKMMATNGLIARGDWLDDLGLDAPTTPEEFLDMLRAFKTEKGAEYPMALTSARMNLLFIYGFFSSPYGLVCSGEYVDDDGKYHIGWAEPEHKQVLEFFHTMYEEELINPDYLTLDQASVDGMLYDGRAGVVQQSVIGGLGTYVPNMAKENPDAELRGIGSLLGPNGERAQYGATELAVASFKGLITTDCENKELAMRFLDWNYSEEGQLFQQFGIEGVSYEMVNGVPTYTELVTNNPDGLTSGQAMNQYSRGGTFWPCVTRLEYFEQVTTMPEQRGAVEVWDANDRYKHMVPSIVIPADLLDEYNQICGEMNTYVSEMRAKFISGEESLDNFDAYLAKLKEMDIERRLEIAQIALDEFNAR